MRTGNLFNDFDPKQEENESSSMHSIVACNEDVSINYYKTVYPTELGNKTLPIYGNSKFR